MINTKKTYVYPISSAQHRLWLLSKFSKANAAYNMTGILKINGNINIDVFEKCIRKIVHRHETLRTSFKEIDGEIKQLITEDDDLEIEHKTVNSEDELSLIINQKAAQSFDLENGPLIRVTVVCQAPDKYIIIISMHHIISDGWSVSIFIRECTEIYNDLIAGNESKIEELATQYVDYTLWEIEQEETEEYQKKLEFWKNELNKAPEFLELPYRKNRPAVQTFDGDVFSYKIEKLFTKDIKNACIKNNVSPFMFLLAAYNIVLNKYSGQTDILIGTPSANRDNPELEGIIGFFVNTLIIRTQIDTNKNFLSYLETVKHTSLKVFENKDISFEKILNLIKPKRNTSYSPVFQVMFSMQNMPSEKLFFGSVPVFIDRPDIVYSKFDLTLSVQAVEDEFELAFEYNTNLFDKDMVEKFCRQYINVLKSVLSDPLKNISDIMILDEEEETLLLETWNDTAFDYPKSSSFIDEFLKVVSSSPDAISFQQEQAILTYKELDEISNQLANYLQENGVENGKTVALYIDRDKHMLPTLLALLKIGATYIPLDPTYPIDRIHYILKDSAVGLIVTNGIHKPFFDTIQTAKIIVNELYGTSEEHKSFKQTRREENSPVYTIYTSGSTGNPKGVRIAENSLLNFLFSMRDQLKITATDKLLAVTSIAFDISGLELYLPLISGGCVVLANGSETKSAAKLVKLITHFNINLMQGTPSLWKMLKEIDWIPAHKIKILCGGEALPKNIVEWFLTLPAEIWNMYGPTETTIWSSLAKITDAENITIGKPIYNTSMYILDQNMRPLPVGLKGDLYIGGDGLAIDYYKREDLVAEKFIDWKYKDRKLRLFKTGDIAKYNSEGDIVFYGRVDDQVKVNGYRIELGEVESKVLHIKEVEKVVARVRNDANGDKQIIAYVELNDELSLTDLRNKLGDYLPSFMIPSFFVIVKEFPLTPNGKIDKKALPDLDDSINILTDKFEAPVTEKEEKLAAIWSEVLGIARIGATDNYFNLGGASLQSVKISNLAEESGLMVTPEMIFEFPTIRELANRTAEITGINTGSTRIKQEEILIPEAHNQNNGVFSEEKAEPNIIIESMGMYLPEKEILSRSIVQDCTNEIRFPIERLTGIKSVRVVEHQYTLGLAEKAVEECMAISKYKPEDIDVVISCNIFRMKNESSISIEPGLSIQLSHKFGFTNALNFDITNACTGIFTSIYLAESFIRSNSAKRCLIVSGEYISHITKTSQLEVESYMDKRIAGLTLGDAGFAMILERSAKKSAGFHYLDFFTMGTYSDLCIVKPTDQKHGGFVVRTDAIKMGEAGHVIAANHALKALNTNNWQLNNINYIIMHQASSTTTQNAMREINRVFDEEVTNSGNIIDNIKERGNTATTTHWVATMDNIINGKIEEYNKIIYCISGSGLNLGTALYTFDDLPERIRSYHKNQVPTKKIEVNKTDSEENTWHKTMKINAVSFRSAEDGTETGMDILYKAVEKCLNSSADLSSSRELDLVVYYGIHRDEYIYEPAVSTFLAGKFEVNSSLDQVGKGTSTFAFDVMNGSMGFLNSCYNVIQLLRNDRCRKALIASSEVNNNERNLQTDESHILEGGAAVVLEESSLHEQSGFGNFVFGNFTQYIDDIKCWAEWEDASIKTIIQKHKENYKNYIRPIIQVLNELLIKENLSLADIGLILSPQLSREFNEAFKSDATFLNWDGIWCDLSVDESNSTLTTPHQFQHIFENNLAKKGDIGLVINVAAGLQVGCAIYYF